MVGTPWLTGPVWLQQALAAATDRMSRHLTVLEDKLEAMERKKK
jgi:hypothetical protein